MKNYFTFFALFICVQAFSSTTLHDQLCDFNFNWKKYERQAPIGEAEVFNTDKAYVQFHLKSVLAILHTNPTSHLNAEQYQLRMHLIEVLDRYRLAGKFPINYYRQYRIPVFIDEHDTHCAVGYLLKETGYEDVAREISAADNYAWIKDIDHKALIPWQKSSGFSMEELKLIQGAYDYYMPNALILPNRYEVPQKPACMTVYFDKDVVNGISRKKKENIWCHGEGENGILNGAWIQNFAVGVPWIEGYYEEGKRTGQWKEYYQGTNKLCRTENWRNDELNGVRRRFDRAGVLIEEILFKDGDAITKINYDLEESLKWVRRPLDSISMWTEVYTLGGALIATGKEKVYNPGNLLWFQNIELTALNSASITSREVVVPQRNLMANNSAVIRFRHPQRNLYNTPPLVEYKKEGEWIYYKEPAMNRTINGSSNQVQMMFNENYFHFGADLFQSINMFEDLKADLIYDSIHAIYSNDRLQYFHGYGKKENVHLQVSYHENLDLISLGNYNRVVEPTRRIKAFGRYNEANQKIGLWKHFDKRSTLYKIEEFIIPWKEEEAFIDFKNTVDLNHVSKGG